MTDPPERPYLPPPGYYRVPGDPSKEAYWNGAEWTPGAPRRARGATTDFPTGAAGWAGAPLEGPHRGGASTSGSLAGAAAFLWFLAVVDALGAIIGAVVLFTRTGCNPNPFASEICSTTHPFAGAGVAVLIGGLVQAFVIGVVAHLCGVVDQLRAAR